MPESVNDEAPPEGRKPSDFFKERLRAVRETKRWSQQQLVDRLAEMGEPMDRATLARTEGSHRTITLDDTVRLAAALDVSPLALFLPLDDEASVTIAPRASMPAGEVREWIMGQMCITAMAFKDESEPSSDLPRFRTIDGRPLEDEEYFERVRFYESQITNRQWKAMQVPGLYRLVQLTNSYAQGAARTGTSWRKAKLEQLQREISRQMADLEDELETEGEADI